MKKSILSVFAVLLLAGANSNAADLLANGLKAWNLQKKGAWELKDGVLSPSEKPGGYIWSKKSYADCEVSLEYKTSERCNSGLFFRTDPKNAVQGGFEIQDPVYIYIFQKTFIRRIEHNAHFSNGHG